MLQEPGRRGSGLLDEMDRSDGEKSDASQESAEDSGSWIVHKCTVQYDREEWAARAKAAAAQPLPATRREPSAPQASANKAIQLPEFSKNQIQSLTTLLSNIDKPSVRPRKFTGYPGAKLSLTPIEEISEAPTPDISTLSGSSGHRCGSAMEIDIMEEQNIEDTDFQGQPSANPSQEGKICSETTLESSAQLCGGGLLSREGRG
ncbi:hypothetical protein MPH_06978 [Macrophomina phaseolina MS6]|uniref:Uncharacterized protein n=1 Tax=Macrophomina phaseolina (strain MS6) TaxID=1126212 RepID=K2S024_MACPH|nr:hypothetical protein MPH_06978 [Macrophomina phaseolina MS6]